ncbi:hypothetical protein M0R45_026794 [Rubus argutus]|uniref:Myb-like domain-containing protein n=1 Tax=Rubus argutus TaxID=59490 RepID=A0AAW1X0E2_RUBAR
MFNRNMEAVDVYDGKRRKKKKKAKSETLVYGEDSSRNMEAVNVEDGKKRKKKAKSEKHFNVEDCNRKSEAVNVEDSKKRKKSKSEKYGNVEDCNRNAEGVNVVDSEKMNEVTSKKRAIVEDCNEDKKSESSKGSLKTQKSISVRDNSEKSTPKKASKRVSFADDVEVFSPSDGSSDEHKDLVRGKWFSEEEDKIVKEAVLRYIEAHALGDDGVDMVMRSKSHPEVKNHPELKTCWKDIGEALPWRPFKSVYYRAHILFERAEKRTWTPEEYEEAFEEKKTKHGMLRDNICWEAISQRLGTRTVAVCNQKWYNQLTSPLVNQKLWADIDDYRLLDALDRLDACCIEDVDWDDLLEHRPGDVCRKRWDQMVKHIGQHALNSFSEQVEVLSKRYRADLIEAREIYASKPVVD